MAARELIAIGAAFTAVILRAEAPASSELHYQLMADTLLAPASDTPAVMRPIPAQEPFTFGALSQLGSNPFAPHLTEDRVTEFFRTGILVGDNHTDHPVKKLSVGPCEGGQLLNLRTSW